MQTSAGEIQLSFDDLSEHLQRYRESADIVFERKFETAEEARGYFFALLLSATRVYFDFLLVLEALPRLYAATDRKTTKALIKSDAARFRMSRKRYEAAMNTLPLHEFTPSGRAKRTFQWKSEDYFKALCLHVPEIYEETLRLDEYLICFQAGVSAMI